MNPLPPLTSAPEIVCVGETMALITPSGTGLAEATAATVGLAGAESNVAAGVAATGHRVVWASRLGADPLGDRIASELERRRVELWVERDADAPTGVMFKDPGVESSSVYYYRRGSAASRMETAFLSSERLEGVRIVHTTGITPALSPSCREMVDRLYADARAAGALVSFDVNDRRPLWSMADAAETLARLADAADIAFVGRDEAERIWGTATPAEIRAFLPHCALLVVKDGDIGATAYDGDADPVFVPAPVVDVVEPVGAGDAFASGFLAATLDGADLASCLSAGHAAAERVLTIAADLPPLEPVA
ncbi:2-dehydro-3-deoxygluconokinase [Microbacterium oxydans]|uniref:2-dehydro-3-deoxygluconokinase n=1 Tax=Microbacterium oxydans TaxID=82380 RepID=A0A0F0L6H5_9MICO|nr:sugar kinase [Microbacterium oxydans]KJL28772.1 2-dehydro-3-deoxygluconokinase [Microbacterium oxydans]CAH0242247.1 2-dehydro-3-deoxygluconokinase [Microbacterium oxydans]